MAVREEMSSSCPRITKTEAMIARFEYMVCVFKCIFSLSLLAGGVGASFQCQLIHQDHICTDDSDKVTEINEFPSGIKSVNFMQLKVLFS